MTLAYAMAYIQNYATGCSCNVRYIIDSVLEVVLGYPSLVELLAGAKSLSLGGCWLQT